MRQEHPTKELFILDDQGNMGGYRSVKKGIRVVSTDKRFPNMVEKYNWMMDECDADMFAVWDDDDIYLPHHLSQCSSQEYYHPRFAYSDYGQKNGRVIVESAIGRFHGSLAFPSNLRYEGTTEPHFDQIMIQKCYKKKFIQTDEPTYVFRWAGSNSFHAQASIGQHGDQWYAKMPRSYTKIFSTSDFDPEYDTHSQKVIRYLNGFPNHHIHTWGAGPLEVIAENNQIPFQAP